jgi:WD40 repeat protein
LPGSIYHLAYSADGRYLVVAALEGIRVYRSSDLSEVVRDTDYGDSSYWAEFDQCGRLITTSLDSYVRLYNADFTLFAKGRAPGGKIPHSACFSPDGTKVAVGFADSTAVNVLSGEDLSFLYAPDTKGVDNGEVPNLAWSQDGEMLYAAGPNSDSSGTNLILKWTKQGRGTITKLPAPTDTVMDLHALKQGRLVFGAADLFLASWLPTVARCSIKDQRLSIIAATKKSFRSHVMVR